MGPRGVGGWASCGGAGCHLVRPYEGEGGEATAAGQLAQVGQLAARADGQLAQARAAAQPARQVELAILLAA